jgi:iron complex transport system substrate-binding protein
VPEIDRPPSRFAWMAGLPYPDRWQGDLRQETREFCRTWYHLDLSAEVLEWAEGRPPG